MPHCTKQMRLNFCGMYSSLIECENAIMHLRMHCWPFSCVLRNTLCVNCARLGVRATVRVSMWVNNVLHIRVVRRGGEGRPVAARRISRSCVVAAGLVARGDTRTEERDVRGGGGIWVVMERLWNWGGKK